MDHPAIIAPADMPTCGVARGLRILHSVLTKKIVYNLVIRPTFIGVELP
jgi:hypothetical protein